MGRLANPKKTKSSADAARAATRAAMNARGLATGAAGRVMGMLQLDVARANDLDGGRPPGCDECVQARSRSLLDRLAQEPCPAEEPAPRTEGLPGPAMEVERIDVVDDQAVLEPEGGVDVVDHRATGL